MGYAHRDVKPHNVLVDPEGHLKVRLKGGGGRGEWDAGLRTAVLNSLRTLGRASNWMKMAR